MGNGKELEMASIGLDCDDDGWQGYQGSTILHSTWVSWIWD